MSRSSRTRFQTIRSEGGLLPADLLQRVAQGDKDLGGLRPEDYHLADLPLNEAIVRSWNRLVGAWAHFRDARTELAEDDPGTTLTRERWLLVLFEELRYGRLQTAKAVEIESKTYPVSHAWGEVPIHLVGCNVPLDRRSSGVAGAATHSPHGLLQELQNRSDERLWGFVSNGLLLRLLRDNSSLTRQAYVEFDLEQLLESEAYSDFVLLWLTCHQSRLEGERPHECWLERWSQEAQRQGTRALDSMRDGVERAISCLGEGFLSHPANAALRESLRSGELQTADYYRELLRLVYRLLFLFVAEDRGLLLAPDAGPEERERYERWYSTRRLRSLAERRRGTKHGDLYEGMKLVMGKLGDDTGCSDLGLPPLGSFLWSERALPHLTGSELANEDLLEAIRALATVREGRVLRAVDYRNLGAEELGSVYESLLELHPEVNADAGHFSLAAAAGNERKTTGSYYTPSSLISVLLDSALDPVLEEAASKGEDAILELKVCDPACGSGHFLVAAAHRIAKRLAAVRTGDEEPPPEATRVALRDVVSRCLYGVDVNPMAVELCKVSLWMEALDPGRPLSFLDAHVKCGNAVVGTTGELMRAGIPDGAFAALGNDTDAPGTLSAQKKANATERAGQTTLDLGDVSTAPSAARALADVDGLPDSTFAEVLAKATSFEAAEHDPALERERLARDVWCAAFFAVKRAGHPPLTTDAVMRALAGTDLSAEQRSLVRALRVEHGYFHWDVEFPSVFLGERSGFDLVLGNPPWKSLSPDLKEFFEPYAPEIRVAKKQDQDAIVEELLHDPVLAERWEHYRHYLLVLAKRFFRKSGRYALFAPGNLGKGDQNIYRMFLETALDAVAFDGCAAQVVPSNFYNGANASAIRKRLLDEWDLHWVLGFVNEDERWFPGVDESTKFTLYAARNRPPSSDLYVGFRIENDEQMYAEVARRRSVDRDTIRREGPDTYAIPESGDSALDVVASKMLAAWPRFGEQVEGLPYRAYLAEIHMGTDRELFVDGLTDEGLPVLEGRMVDQYDYRAKAYASGRGRAARWDELPFGSADKRVVPQWRIPLDRIPAKLGDRPQRYRVAWNDVASPERGRALKAALIPPGSVCGHVVPTLEFTPDYTWQYMPLLAEVNSLVADALVRRLISLHVTFSVFDALPLVRWPTETSLAVDLGVRALRLSCTGPETVDYWNAMAARGWVEPVAGPHIPDAAIDAVEREQLRMEIEGLVAHDVFELTRDEFEIVLDSFTQLGATEEREHGEFRTRRLALAAYDERASTTLSVADPACTETPEASRV